MSVLADADLDAALIRLTDWRREGAAIVRTVTLADFAAAVELVNAVAAVAEAVGHHPEITIRWRRVTLTLSTHSEGGVTARDVGLAERIDALVESRGPGGPSG